MTMCAGIFVKRHSVSVFFSVLFSTRLQADRFDFFSKHYAALKFSAGKLLVFVGFHQNEIVPQDIRAMAHLSRVRSGTRRLAVCVRRDSTSCSQFGAFGAVQKLGGGLGGLEQVVGP